MLKHIQLLTGGLCSMTLRLERFAPIHSLNYAYRNSDLLGRQIGFIKASYKKCGQSFEICLKRDDKGTVSLYPYVTGNLRDKKSIICTLERKILSYDKLPKIS